METTAPARTNPSLDPHPLRVPMARTHPGCHRLGGCAGRWAVVMFAAVIFAAVGAASTIAAPVPSSLTTVAQTAVRAEAPTRAHGVPGGPFPSTRSPRDGLVTLVVFDTSCDEEALSRKQIFNVIFGLVTVAAWHEGDFGIATMRNNTILTFRVQWHPFRSSKHSDEAVRRDLWKQRNDVNVDALADDVVHARRGPCRTDELEAFRQIQAELSSMGVGTRPVTVTVISNGVVVARGRNFMNPQPPAARLVQQLHASGEIAQLPVNLVFVGIGRRAGVGTRKLMWLQEFWSRYAVAAGGHPTLIRTADDLIARLGGGS
jgi:hypothetical protein